MLVSQLRVAEIESPIWKVRAGSLKKVPAESTVRVSDAQSVTSKLNENWLIEQPATASTLIK